MYIWYIIFIAYCILGIVICPKKARSILLQPDFYPSGVRHALEVGLFYLLFILFSPIYPIAWVVQKIKKLRHNLFTQHHKLQYVPPMTEVIYRERLPEAPF